VVVAVAVTLLVRNEETQSKIAAIEKQMREKEVADALRERNAKAQAEEEERQRKAQSPTRPEEKAPPEITPKAEPTPAPPKTEATKGETPRGRQATAGKPRGDEKMVRPPPKAPPPGSEPSQPVKEQVPAPPAQSPPAAPQVAKPQTPAELLAEADRATKAQHYADAVAILKPLADAGNAQAQFRLGEAYAEGRGVDRNVDAAESWYEKAALQGETSAQLKLGAMFANGKGVARNNNAAYIWYGMAARLGSGPGKAERDKLAALLQPAEREQADKTINKTLEGMKKE
jgi:hypothetical protein